jgi:hypothetical protein
MQMVTDVRIGSMGVSEMHLIGQRIKAGIGWAEKVGAIMYLRLFTEQVFHWKIDQEPREKG